MENFFDRLGNIFRSYLNDSESFDPKRSKQTDYDADYAEAYEELNEFLKNGQSARRERTRTAQSANASYARKPRQAGTTTQRRPPEKPAPPYALMRDFQQLGVEFGAPLSECKIAYRKLLKKHHPDRHAGDPAALKRATALSAKINASFQHIEQWYETGKLAD